MNIIKRFTLLSIGHRGVGKTVFLAGSYAELLSDGQTFSPKQLWFECQDSQAQKNLDRVLSYIGEKGEYPPPTLKVTNFNFSLKLSLQNQKKSLTISHFRWRDIPGEICSLSNINFDSMAFSSHGCCVFIDAYALVHSDAYAQVLKDMFKQLLAIAYLYGSRYPFALVLTKYDLLSPGHLSRQQLEKKLQPLTIPLDAMKANYQIFYSRIPLVHTGHGSALKPRGAAAALLWLVWELNKAQNRRRINNLLALATPLLPRCFQPREAKVEQALESLIEPYGKVFRAKEFRSSYPKLANFKYILLTVLILVSLLGIVGTFLIKEAVKNEQDRHSKTVEFTY